MVGRIRVAHNRWSVLLAATVGMSLGLSVYPPFVFGLFIKPLAADYGWSRAQISLGVTICNYTCLLASPLLGQLIDRVGARRVVLPCIVGFAAAVAAGALNTGSLVFFYLLHFAIPALALGTLPHSYTRLVVGWFADKRGLAVGVTVAGVGLGGLAYPQVIQRVMELGGWRTGYVAAALLILLVSLPVAFAFLREPPEALPGAPPAATAQGDTLRQALGRRAFWLLLAIMSCMGMVTTGMTVHLVPLLSDRGLSPDHAAQGVGLLALAVVVGRIGAGFLLDRLLPGLVAFTLLGVSAAGLAVLADAPGGAATNLAILMVGVGIGAEFDFLSFFIARHLGLRAYGAIYGWTYSGFMLGCGVGPPLMGLAFDRTGAYSPALAVLAAAAAMAATLFLFFPRSTRPGLSPQPTVQS